MNKNKLVLYTIFIITSLLINSCGFHLRGLSGSYKFPFSKVYLQCDTTILCRNLNSAIKTQNSATIVNKPGKDTVTIQLDNEQTSRDPQRFNAAGRIAAYNLTYQVDAKVIQNYEQLGDSIHISVNSVMNYNDSQILSANQNEAQLWENLHEAATNQLIRRLVYFKYYKPTVQNESYSR
ncbi:MAG: LPS assembly lipoprotein LptE [Neisseriaceae bacterium]|jgi:outer membrane lipopolysaccharide assembly protein LptE/RlpB